MQVGYLCCDLRGGPVTSLALNRRGFLGGLIATLGASAAAAAVVRPLALPDPLLVGTTRGPLSPDAYLKDMEAAQAEMVGATRTMVEDAIAEAREFNLR